MHEGLECVSGDVWICECGLVYGYECRCMSAQMSVCECVGVSVFKRVWIHVSVHVWMHVWVHLCVSAYAHMSGCALQKVLSCLVGVPGDGHPVPPQAPSLSWSCLGPGRPLPKVEKVCWRFRGPGPVRPFVTCRESPPPWGLWLGLSTPKDIGRRRGHISARAPATIFLTILILSSLLLLLSHLFLISLTVPLLLSMHFIYLQSRFQAVEVLCYHRLE